MNNKIMNPKESSFMIYPD